MKNKLLKHFGIFRIVALLLMLLSFSTNSNAQIIAESFEGKNFPPPGWTVGPNWSLATWSMLTGDASHGNNSISHYTINNSGVNGFIVTPAVTLQAGQQIQLSFDYSILDSDGGQASLLIGSTSALDDYGNVFDPAFETLNFTEITPYDTHTVTYIATEDEVKYFYFSISSEWNHPFSIVMDKIVIENVADCSLVTNLSVNTVTANSASIGWHTPAGVSEWQVQITQGSLPTEANWIAATAAPMTFNGLVPGTDYTVYVRSKCGEEYGFFSNPVSFTTPCQDVITAPYTIGFVIQELPHCWTQSGDTEWQFNLFADYGAEDAGDHTLLQSATNYAWIDGSDNTAGLTTTLISPIIDISALETPALEFYAYSANKVGNVYNELLVEVFDGTDWEPIATLDEASNGWKFYSIELDPEAANVQARFTVTGNGELTYYNDILIDDISFKEKTTCYPAQNLSTDSITATTIEIVGESENEDATWDVAYGTYLEVFNGTPDLVGVELPYTLTELESSTYYYIYLRANCGDETGNWTGPFVAMTDCIVYFSPYIQDFTPLTSYPYSFDSPGYPNCWDEALGGSLISGPLQFGVGNWKVNRDAIAGTVTNSEAVSVSFFGSNENSWLLSPVFDLSGSEYEAKIRIAITASNISPAIINMGSDDEVRLVYSENGENWQTLKVWSVQDNISTGYYTAIIPLDDIDGEVRFAFWSNEGLADNIIYQFHVDNFEIREKSICPEPVNLLADGMTDQTAVLSWDSTEGATSWFIAVVSAGATPTDADWTTVNTNPYVWTGLTANTAYDFYIRSVCGSSTSDIMSGPFSFKTRCTPLIAPYTETFVEYQTVPPCWINNPIQLDMQLFAVNFWNYTTTATADAAAAGDHTTGGGSNYAWLNTANYINQERAILTTALVDISPLENPAFQFYLFSENTTDNALNHVIVKIFNGTAWQELTRIISYTNGWAEHTIDLSAFAGNAPVQIQFEVLVNSNGGYPGYNQILIDDVSFMEMPSCPAPFNLQVSDITESTALVSWENASSVNMWKVEYGPTGFTPGEGIVMEVSTNPEIILNELEQGESYDVYVTALCDDGKTIGPTSFTVDIVAGTDNIEINKITCYPNPATNTLHIKSDIMMDKIEVYNIFGQLVKQHIPANSLTSIEINMLSSGMYLVKVYSDNSVSVFKIIKK